ncbi:MAG TPA: flavin reductase family protein [Flavobacterium sp.]|uniref:flavin reductase family protein n=1 Tax=Flavobacterium sp. TaxID=239 RepID=UPI002B771E4F|nr:flavin reductase family protein [Flavobacterium sp.]HNP33894.1 flavin reductase family protein [Flavobacterium sp.]
MQFDPNELEHTAVYKLLTGAIIPRPIGWISSVSENGINNLAPFSYFNAVGDDPPHVMFSTGRGNDTNKDTLNNVLATKQFVVNMVTEELTEQMNATAQAVHSDIDEFELAGVTAIKSDKVKPMRVKESPISFECELVHHYFLEDHKHGGACVIIGRIVMMHFDDAVLLDNHKINLQNYKPVSRLAGSGYAKMGEIFSVKRN